MGLESKSLTRGFAVLAFAILLVGCLVQDWRHGSGAASGARDDGPEWGSLVSDWAICLQAAVYAIYVPHGTLDLTVRRGTRLGYGMRAACVALVLVAGYVPAHPDVARYSIEIGLIGFTLGGLVVAFACTAAARDAGYLNKMPDQGVVVTVCLVLALVYGIAVVVTHDHHYGATIARAAMGAWTSFVAIECEECRWAFALVSTLAAGVAIREWNPEPFRSSAYFNVDALADATLLLYNAANYGLIAKLVKKRTLFSEIVHISNSLFQTQPLSNRGGFHVTKNKAREDCCSDCGGRLAPGELEAQAQQWAPVAIAAAGTAAPLPAAAAMLALDQNRQAQPEAWASLLASGR